MSGSRDDELDRLREERLEAMQNQGQQDEEIREAQQEAVENQKRAILQQFLTDGARKRLNTVRMGRPDHAEQIEQQLLALIQSGRIEPKIDEGQMKQLLRKLQPESQDFNIRRR